MSETLKRQILIKLVFLHIFIIALSNYLVQIPVNFFGFIATLGTFTFPFIFLLTDLTVRIFGAKEARKIVFFVMFPALLLSYFFSIIFIDGKFSGFSELGTFNIFVFRIALASFLAYALGQILDIFVFSKFRENKKWFVAPTLATIISNLLDTFLFYFIAFYKSQDEFLSANWIHISFVDYAFKIFVCAVFFLPLYGFLLKKIFAYLEGKNYAFY